MNRAYFSSVQNYYSYSLFSARTKPLFGREKHTIINLKEFVRFDEILYFITIVSVLV